MAGKHVLFILLGAVIAAFGAASYFDRPSHYAGLECARERIVAFGWTNKDRVLAEMAAILQWERQARARKAAAYTQWVHARDRYLSCRNMQGKSHHIQCKISATPCRLSAQS
ncbi:MAG: hypothetical protein Kow0032_05550 [Methyloligellaceae bacterium]